MIPLAPRLARANLLSLLSTIAPSGSDHETSLVVRLDGDDRLWHNEKVSSMTQKRFRTLVEPYLTRQPRTVVSLQPSEAGWRAYPNDAPNHPGKAFLIANSNCGAFWPALGALDLKGCVPGQNFEVAVGMKDRDGATNSGGGGDQTVAFGAR